jgi:hypothetical protein|tara:strand:+ start:590 stop:745 length:156 start_codon:yes stop_codon:yes gene_type:complete
MDQDKESQISVRVTESEKQSLIALAKQKGCNGLTGLLRLLARAKEVIIKEL